MRRTRIYNASTGKWEYWTVSETPLRPWRFVRLEALLALRGLGAVLRGIRRRPQELEFDPETLTCRDRRAGRRWLRLARRAERRGRFAKVAHAVMAMVEMQKHIG